MLTSSLLPLLTLISPIASLSLPITNNHQQQPLSKPKYDEQSHLKTHFRDIQPKDLPAITTVLVEAFSPSATWHYLMPDLQHHKPEVWTCLHNQVEHAWETRNTTRTFGKVITVVPPPSSSSSSNSNAREDEESQEGRQEIPVSFSFWSIRHRSDSSSTTNHFSIPSILASASPCLIPPGTNLTRALDFNRQNALVEHEYFIEPYPHQFYLALLATHPSWDGHGFGARHVQWGQDLSLELQPQMPVTLLASPAGFPLYDSLGFESVKNATMPMLDGLGELWFEVMRWGWKR
ncbi:hypothetical protein MBLNU13_g05578t1 [Cladosporium sp. NU13]